MKWYKCIYSSSFKIKYLMQGKLHLEWHNSDDEIKILKCALFPINAYTAPTVYDQIQHY